MIETAVLHGARSVLCSPMSPLLRHCHPGAGRDPFRAAARARAPQPTRAHTPRRQRQMGPGLRRDDSVAIVDKRERRTRKPRHPGAGRDPFRAAARARAPQPTPAHTPRRQRQMGPGLRRDDSVAIVGKHERRTRKPRHPGAGRDPFRAAARARAPQPTPAHTPRRQRAMGPGLRQDDTRVSATCNRWLLHPLARGYFGYFRRSAGTRELALAPVARPRHRATPACEGARQ